MKKIHIKRAFTSVSSVWYLEYNNRIVIGGICTFFGACCLAKTAKEFLNEGEVR